ncbi:hypothetical protein BaRGS_00003092 [Batillaria attramentaria]|uniref:Glycine cleavage system H protein, mitochondrial n=1 Tax=Batillaria attramentaria TaxID=370345 RepID=A0ABD0M2T6_9CAEN
MATTMLSRFAQQTSRFAAVALRQQTCALGPKRSFTVTVRASAGEYNGSCIFCEMALQRVEFLGHREFAALSRNVEGGTLCCPEAQYWHLQFQSLYAIRAFSQREHVCTSGTVQTNPRVIAVCRVACRRGSQSPQLFLSDAVSTQRDSRENLSALNTQVWFNRARSFGAWSVWKPVVVDLSVAKRYTEKHEWIELNGSIGTVGISQYAQESLGEIVYVQLPEVGSEVETGGDAGCLESVKAASDIYSPVAGLVTEVNGTLTDTPNLINSSPLEKGWIFKLEVADKGEVEGLMDEDAYKKFLESNE